MSCPSFAVDDTLGALLIGTLVSYALFGVTTTQVYVYYGRSPKDSLWIKSLVAGVWCGECAHAVCIAISIYTMVITNFGHAEHIGQLPNSLLASTLIASVVLFCVQVFFAYRIYALSKNLWIPCICWALSLSRLVPPNVVVFLFGRSEPFPKVIRKWAWLFDSIWAASAVNDMLIAGTLVFLLYSRRSIGLKRTTAVVDKLIAWTIETGVVTSIASIVMLGVFVSMPDNLVWMAWFVVVPRLFSNSLLASLNSRGTLRFEDDAHSIQVISTLPRPTNPTGILVEMNKVTITTCDD
ncbi:hypothetical protein B0H19DRAFT_1104226 [Mycena capillaripes]|nr:hypothetical protein B0H19DRAFT_1104226 [Mycena capillaripes]